MCDRTGHTTVGLLLSASTTVPAGTTGGAAITTTGTVLITDGILSIADLDTAVVTGTTTCTPVRS